MRKKKAIGRWMHRAILLSILFQAVSLSGCAALRGGEKEATVDTLLSKSTIPVSPSTPPPEAPRQGFAQESTVN